jgi:hypothetical protein
MNSQNKTNLILDNIANELFEDKLMSTYWSEVNKRYLIRIYHPLVNVMDFVSKPKWSNVIHEMLGHSHPGYYSCVYKVLKEIGVIKYNPIEKVLVKGPNWDRFYSDESWDWFYMNTSSGCISYETHDKMGNKVNKRYPSNYRGGHPFSN